MTATALRRRFVVLRGTRWLPTGLLIPVFVLLLTGRGLSLVDVGAAFAVQGVMVMLLELPTGGLADSVGRRRVLLGATWIDLASLLLLLVATTLPAIACVMALQGIYRALESGPLDAWYVDTTQLLHPEADVGAGIAAGGTIIGVSIAAGSIVSSVLVAAAPVPSMSLTLPIVVAAVLRGLDLLAIRALMTEVPDPSSRPVDPQPGDVGAARSTWAMMAVGLRTVRASNALMGLLCIEALWGAGMTAFETFTPPRLEQVLGGAAEAAAAYGPASAVGWIAAAAGAAVVPPLMRRLDLRWIGVWSRVVQGVTVLGIGLLGTPLAVATAFVATMLVHGGANVAHQAILHRQVDGPSARATIVSANSLAASLGGAVGGIGLGVAAVGLSLPVAIALGALLLALPAPLYLTARRQSSDRPVAPVSAL